MKKYTAALVCIVLQTIMLMTSDRDLFEKANQYFTQENWSEALHTYKAMRHKNSAVLQNMGSCYFNQERYVEALLSWKRAYRNCSFGEIAQLCAWEQAALKKLNSKSPSIECGFLRRIMLSVPLIAVQVFLILCLLVLLWMLYRCWRWQEITRRDRKRLWCITFMTLFLGAVWYGQESFFQKNKAMVVKEHVLVYAGPEQTFHVATNLSAGDVVQVLQKKQGMYNITNRCTTGWVMQNTIEFIYNYE